MKHVLIETPQCRKPQDTSDVKQSKSTGFSKSSSTASKQADKENDGRRGNELKKEMIASYQESEEGHQLKTLVTKIADQRFSMNRPSQLTSGGGSSIIERAVLKEINSNPFDDEAYMKQIGDFKQETAHHYSLIPRALQDQQYLSDFDCLSGEDPSEYQNPFTSTSNFLLGAHHQLHPHPSTNSGHLNLMPAPRHSMPYQMQGSPFDEAGEVMVLKQAR